MAQNTGTQSAQSRTAQAANQAPTAPAVLRQGRAADPLPAVPNATPDANGVAHDLADNPLTRPQPNTTGSADINIGVDAVDPRAARQRDLRLIMRQCDRVLLADYALLAMESWPDNARLSAARYRRDLWLLVMSVAAVLLAGAVVGVLPAWLGGTGFGVLVTTLVVAFPPIRRVFSSRASYGELVRKRRQLLNDARRHVAHLEGQDGLLWQCARMVDFNPLLASFSFSNLLEASEQHTLVRQLNARKYVRLYLFYLVEAEKAYQRLQQAFLDGHQKALDDELM